MIRKSRSNAEAGAFTLIELLVVIAIIGILAGLLLPALARVKARGEGILCGGNQRQMMLAFFLYANDQQDALPYNLGTAETRRTIEEGTYLNWVNHVLNWETDPQNTNTFLLTAGGLGPYLTGGLKVFRCPADTVLSEAQRQAGWTHRTRSYSMNLMVGNAGAFTETGMNSNNPYYEQFFKLADLDHPSQVFVFIEEHPDSINDGYFQNRHYSLEWNDLPASYHNGAANLAFADGHVESHRWVVSSTKPPSRPDAAPLPYVIPAVERADFDWLMSRLSRKRN